MKEQYEMDQFLTEIRAIENKINHLLQQSGLSDEEKDYILDHILVVPDYNEKVFAENCAS